MASVWMTPADAPLCRSPKKRWPFQLVPVIALAIWDRLPKVVRERRGLRPPLGTPQLAPEAT